MYVLHDTQSADGSHKASTLADLKRFAELAYGISTEWIRFSGSNTDNVATSPCDRFEAEKVDGRTVRDIPEIYL